MKPWFQCAWAQRVVATVPVDDPFRVHHTLWRRGGGVACAAGGRPLGLALGFLPPRGRRGSGVRAGRRPPPQAVRSSLEAGGAAPYLRGTPPGSERRPPGRLRWLPAPAQAAWLSRNSAIASAGVFQPSTLRGRPFSSSATSASRCGGARQVAALGEVLAQQPVGVLVAGPLPGRVRVAEVDLAVRGDRDLRVQRHLLALVPGQRPAQAGRQARDHRGHRRRERCRGLPARHRHQHRVPGGALDQGADLRLARLPGDQVAFPVPGHRPVLRLGRPLADVHHAPRCVPRRSPSVRRGLRSDRPVRRCRASSRRSAPRPCTYSAW